MARELEEREVATAHEPMTATVDEQVALRGVEKLLDKATQGHCVKQGSIVLRFEGEEIELPRSVVLLLCRIVPHLRKGHALTVVPFHKELTSQEAADILNVSRPFLIGLLERGEIPYVTTGKHRRIRLGDLMEYKKRREAIRRQSLSRLTELSQEYGLDRYED